MDQYSELADLSIAELVEYYLANPDHKSDKDITVKVDDITYKVPNYCITDLLKNMPNDQFFPCSFVEWFNHPVYFTYIEMVKGAIKSDPGKFVAFILYK